MMQTMRRPHLLPCGHIGDKSSLLKFAHCSFDRHPFHPDQLLPIDPTLSYLCKGSDSLDIRNLQFLDTATDKWTVHIVDFFRTPLDAKTYYHSTCGNFFNMATIVATNKELSPDDDQIEETILVRICCDVTYTEDFGLSCVQRILVQLASLLSSFC